MTVIRNIIIGIVTLSVITYIGFSYYLAKSIVKPDVLTLTEERQWIEEHDLVGDFDHYHKEELTVQGYQNYQLHAQIIKADNDHSDKYVIISHGFRSNRNGAIKYVDSYHKLGYHVITYDVRGHGENQPTAVSLGHLESKDLLALIQYTYERFGHSISLGLHGESMGSATSLSVLAEHPKLDFVVADCGFTNLYDLIEGAYQDNHLGFLIYGVNAVTKWGFGIDLKETSPIKSVKDNQVPILFIHGEKDNFIKPENSQKLFETNPSKDQLVIVPKAEHASSREILGEEAYTDLIKNFINSLK